MFKDLFAKLKRQLHFLAFGECLVVLFALAAVFQKVAANSYRRVGIFLLSLLISVLLYVVFSVLWQQLTKRISIAYGRFLRSTSLIFIPIFAALFLGERPSANVCLGILIIMVGLFLIQRPSIKEEARETFREQQGSTFFHFFGDAMTMVSYRDMPTRSRESFFFKFVNKKKAELDELRKQREIAKEKEKIEKEKRLKEEERRLAEAKRLQEEHEIEAKKELEARAAEVKANNVKNADSTNDKVVVQKSSAADIASSEKVSEESSHSSSSLDDKGKSRKEESSSADDLREETVVMASTVVDYTAENSELKDIPDKTVGNDVSDVNNVEGLEERK